MVKNLPSVKEMQVWEGPLEKEMATHSSILAWEIRATVMGSQRLSHNLATEQQNNKSVFLAQAF